MSTNKPEDKIRDGIQMLEFFLSNWTHIDRITTAIQENSRLFGARAGDYALESAADYLEKIAKEHRSLNQ